MGIWHEISRPRLWKSFYWQWFKSAFVPSFGLADRIAFTLFLLVPAGIWAYKKWSGQTISIYWDGVLTDLSWMIPVGLLAAVTVLRFLLAPYWTYREALGSFTGSEWSPKPRYEGKRGSLEMLVDLPKAAADVTRLTSKLTGHTQNIGGDISKANDRAQKLKSDRKDTVGRRIKEAQWVAKKLRRYGKRVEGVYPQMDTAATRLTEDIAGAIQRATEAGTNIDELVATGKALTEWATSYSGVIENIDIFLEGLQQYVDKPQTKDLGEAAFETVSGLRTVRGIYITIESACDEANKVIHDKVAELSP